MSVKAFTNWSSYSLWEKKWSKKSKCVVGGSSLGQNVLLMSREVDFLEISSVLQRVYLEEGGLHQQSSSETEAAGHMGSATQSNDT